MHNQVNLVTEDSPAMEEIAASATLQPNQQLKVLVLFSGTGSVERALHRYFPNVVSVSVDNEQKFAPTHCRR